MLIDLLQKAHHMKTKTTMFFFSIIARKKWCHKDKIKMLTIVIKLLLASCVQTSLTVSRIKDVIS